EVSHDFGSTFVVEQSLRPAAAHDWGDADYLATGSNGTLYVAWDYGPSNPKVKSACSPTGSCWATHGDLNVAVQSSTNEGQTFSPISVVNPGYPDGGADEGDVTIAPDGAVDVLYQGYEVVNRRTLQLADGHEYFTTSTDGGARWSPPVEVGASAGQITINEWWNDGSIAADSAGDLYATWDTQGEVEGQKTDTGWVSFSTDGGLEWSAPVQASPDQTDVPHITEVTGAGPGEAYVAWLSSSDPSGYALFLRTFSISADGGAGGWLSGAAQISQQFGNPRVFPGDTFGIATFSQTDLALSWGSAVPGADRKTSVFAAAVGVVSEAVDRVPAHRATSCRARPTLGGAPRVPRDSSTCHGHA
ncbi:MAG TPA: sialidase family protein, partial [Acidimicrobiales bacterium]|nr:sialidase family protein [Acidimicrobiales bacterium]